MHYRVGSVDLMQREKMKKIHISSFRKKFDDASFQVLKNIVNNSFEKNTTINIAMISRAHGLTDMILLLLILSSRKSKYINSKKDCLVIMSMFLFSIML